MAGLTMIAMKGSLAVPFITAFPILLLFCSRSIFAIVLFLLCFAFTDCSLRRGRRWGWVGLCYRKQWLFSLQWVNGKKTGVQVMSVYERKMKYDIVKKIWSNRLIHLLPWRWRLNVSPKCCYLSINFYDASSPEYHSNNLNCCRNFRFYKKMSQGKFTCNYRRTVGEWLTLRAILCSPRSQQLCDSTHSADRSSLCRSKFEIRATEFIIPPPIRSY